MCFKVVATVEYLCTVLHRTLKVCLLTFPTTLSNPSYRRRFCNSLRRAHLRQSQTTSNHSSSPTLPFSPFTKNTKSHSFVVPPCRSPLLLTSYLLPFRQRTSPKSHNVQPQLRNRLHPYDLTKPSEVYRATSAIPRRSAIGTAEADASIYNMCHVVNGKGCVQQ